MNLRPRGGRESNTQSCGCLRREATARNKKTHGHSRKGKWTVTYSRWANMKSRCSNPKNKHFKDYGGRGITYDPRWAKFEEFLKDMGETPEGLMLERRNNDLGYSKENCYWATPLAQGRNSRKNHVLVYRGKRGTLSQWCEWTGLASATIRKRIERGWSIKKALMTPALSPSEVAVRRHKRRWGK